MKKILFIGGAGFIGSNLIRSINRGKYHVMVVEPECAYTDRLRGLDLKLIHGALDNVEFIKDLVKQEKIQIVVHLVSTLIPGSSYEDYKQEYKNVIFPSIELMEFCAQKGVRFVYFSSGGTIYGNRNDVLPFVEADPMAPISYYGWSKQMMENSILFMHRTAGLNYLIVRPSNPYGHGQNLYGKQGLVAVAIGKILKGEPVEVWGDGSAVRDYIYIDDLARVFAQLVEKDVKNVTLNIGAGRGYSVNDVLAFLKIVTRQDFKIQYKDPRPVDVSNMVLDLSNLKQYVDVEFTPFMEGIRTFYKDSIRKKV
jgi:UDP-glucose 4-epimerase